MARDRHAAHQILRVQNLRSIENRLRLRQARPRRRLDDLQLLFERRIADLDIEHESIELSFRQRIGAFLLDRILRGEHEERQLERVGLPAGSHLVLLHGLQQCRLGSSAACD